jgi:iron complex outermembrane receptor protein
LIDKLSILISIFGEFMRKIIGLSAVVSTLLIGSEIELSTVFVKDGEDSSVKKESIRNSKRIELSEILSDSVPSVEMSRSGGLGNDIIIRGQQRDNIAVTVDDALIYGACPNRMDPAIMHISSDQVGSLKVGEGVYSVRNFGALSGSLQVETREPEEGFKGKISGGAGSFGSYRTSADIEGGDEQIQGAGGFSYEESEQYTDGNGDTMAEQLQKLNPKMAYSDSELKSFKRLSYWGKLIYSPVENHQLRLNYSGDQSDDVLYPVFMMDGITDKSDLYSVEYRGYSLLNFSDEFRLKYYYSSVEHSMSNEFRVSGANGSKTHKIDSTVNGFRAENRFQSENYDSLLGLDVSNRQWHGILYSNTDNSALFTMVPDVNTEDIGLYSELKYGGEKFDIEGGVRLDVVSIQPDDIANINGVAKKSGLYSDKKRDFNGVSANILTRYYLSEKSSLYAGVGRSFRVPDGKEMYMNKPNSDKTALSIQGNPELNPSYNHEVDGGFQGEFGDNRVNVNLFYSSITDFIYAYNNGSGLSFQNIDASIYGGDMTLRTDYGRYFSTNLLLSYQRGEKSEAISGQNDTDLAGIPPLKGSLALLYDTKKWSAEIKLSGATDQDVDRDNGEKDISGYFLTDLKGSYSFTKNLQLSGGVSNLFDEVYQLNNSYIGRNVIGVGDPSDIAVLNEPGREVYFNLDYKF